MDEKVSWDLVRDRCKKWYFAVAAVASGSEGVASESTANGVMPVVVQLTV